MNNTPQNSVLVKFGICGICDFGFLQFEQNHRPQTKWWCANTTNTRNTTITPNTLNTNLSVSQIIFAFLANTNTSIDKLAWPSFLGANVLGLKNELH